MQQLDVPVPPMLERAVGYGGQARFVALYWGAGDEAYFNDGRSSGTGHPHGYLAFVRHPAVALPLAGHDLGSSDGEAAEWLVVDRRSRRAFVAPVAEARRFLRDQWNESPVGPAVLTQEEFAAVFNQLRRDFESRPMPTPAEIMASMRERQRLERRWWHGWTPLPTQEGRGGHAEDDRRKRGLIRFACDGRVDYRLAEGRTGKGLWAFSEKHFAA